MVLIKRHFSYIVYILALLVLVGGAVDLVFSFRDFILSGKGIGVYGGFVYYALAMLSVVLWFVSYFFSKNNTLAIIYWSVFLVLTGFVIAQPTWWSAPSISS